MIPIVQQNEPKWIKTYNLTAYQFDMIRSKKLNYVEIKTIEQAESKWLIIHIFYLLLSNSNKTCKNGSKMTKNVPETTLFDIILLLKKAVVSYVKLICWPDSNLIQVKSTKINILLFPNNYFQSNNLPKLNLNTQ